MSALVEFAARKLARKIKDSFLSDISAISIQASSMQEEHRITDELTKMCESAMDDLIDAHEGDKDIPGEDN